MKLDLNFGQIRKKTTKGFIEFIGCNDGGVAGLL
jgi:hypothetical protein